MPVEIVEVLHRVPFFAGVDNDELHRLAALGAEWSYDAGDLIFREGDSGHSLFIVLSGSVQIYRALEDDTRAELAELGAGSFFGEMSLLDGEPRSACVAATEPTRVFVLEREDVLALLGRAPRMLGNVLSVLSGKVRSSNDGLLEAMITHERVRAEGELARHRSIAEMVAGIAHEINTPLGIVNSAASFVTDALSPRELASLARDETALSMLGDVAEACRLIQANIARANELVRSFQKLSVRQLVDRLETLDLRALTREVVDLFRIQAKRSGITIEVHADDEPWPWRGFPGHYAQVLLNLLTNVERYAYPSGRGGPALIHLARAPERERYEVSVSDRGVGIPEADLPKVFDAFFTTGRDKGGTGLGMSIVYNLVTSSLRGTVAVRSSRAVEDGQPAGTTVTLSFPVDLGEDAERPCAEDASR